MRLRAILADRLALTLLQTQGRNDARPEEKDEKQRRHGCAGRAERDVTKKVERTEQVREVREPRQHLLILWLTRDGDENDRATRRRAGPCGCRSSPSPSRCRLRGSPRLRACATRLRATPKRHVCARV